MRNRDTILLEEAYKDIVKEMAYTPKEGGRQLTGTYRPSMPRYSQMPSTEKVSKIPRSEEEFEQRKLAATQTINDNFKLLETDPNNISAARDILNTINSFEEYSRINAERGKDVKTARETFLIGTEELTYEEVLRKLLKLTTTEKNDPSLIMVKKDPETFQETPGLTIDEYLKGEGRDADHYYLFRDILKALPDTEGQVRSRREKAKEDPSSKNRSTQDIYYFAKTVSVYEEGEQIGYYNKGCGFYPNDLGKEKGYYSKEILESPNPKKRGSYFMSPRMWNKFKKSKNLEFKDEVILPYRSSVFIDISTNKITGGFWESNARIPRRKGEPNFAPAPLPWEKARPEEIAGMTLEEVRFAVNNDEAEEEFKKLYPEDKYPFLYKHGRFAGKVEESEGETKENE